MLDLRKTPRIRTSHVVAGAALVLITTGGATAAGLVTGKDIKDGSVTTKDVKNGSLVLKDFKATERSKLVGATGANGTNGSQWCQRNSGSARAQPARPGPAGDAGGERLRAAALGHGDHRAAGSSTATSRRAGVSIRNYSPLPFTHPVRRLLRIGPATCGTARQNTAALPSTTSTRPAAPGQQRHRTPPPARCVSTSSGRREHRCQRRLPWTQVPAGGRRRGRRQRVLRLGQPVPRQAC